MRSKWSAKAAKKLADSYDRSVKGLHPDTESIVRLVHGYAERGTRVTYHSVPDESQQTVAADLRLLGYTVIKKGPFSPGSTKLEVRVP